MTKLYHLKIVKCQSAADTLKSQGRRVLKERKEWEKLAKQQQLLAAPCNHHHLRITL
jgi:hypothetical protein